MIQLNERVTLIATPESIVNGKVVRDDAHATTRTVFAHVGSISQTEFYSSAQAGFELSCKITMWAIDYKGERDAEHNSIRYHVERDYITPAGMIELTCSRAKGRG